MQKYRDNITIQGRGGLAPVRNANVTVYNHGANDLAVIYSNAYKTPMSNPFQSDSLGGIFFYAENGHYDILVQGSGQELRIDDVLMEEVYEDVDALDSKMAVIEPLALGAAQSSNLSDSVDKEQGASLIGFDGGNVADLLENWISLSNYSELRSYSGRGLQVRIKKDGISGEFLYDQHDTTTPDNGGTVIVDAAGRRWKRSYEGASLLQWFEPVGDGSADDTAALQKWIASNVKLQGYNGVFRLASGVLTVDKGFSDSFYLDGAGMLLVGDSASTSAILGVNKALYPVVRGVRVDGKKHLKPPIQTNSIGIRFQDCLLPIAEDNYVYNTQEHGIAVYYYPNNVPIWYGPGSRATIIGNTVEDVGSIDEPSRGDGIWIFGEAVGNIVSQNRAIRCRNGITIDDSSGSGPLRDNSKNVISGNVVLEAIGYACRYETGHEASITGNIFICTGNPSGQTVTGAGLLFRAIQEADSPTGPGAISGNYIKGVRKAVELASAANVNVSGNVLVQEVGEATLAPGDRPPSGVDIFIWNSNAIPCRSNVVSNNTIIVEGHGVSVGSTPPSGNPIVDDTYITANKIFSTIPIPESGGSSGIYSQYMSNLNVQGNYIHGFAYGVRILAGPSSVPSGQLSRFVGNYVKDCRSGMLFGYQHGLLVMGNTTIGNQSQSMQFYSGADSSKSVCLDNIMFDLDVTGSNVQKPRVNSLVSI